MKEKVKKTVADLKQTRSKQGANAEQSRSKRASNIRQIRFAFAPILREFRQLTKRNEARLWIPVETSLLVRYEFASCSIQTRYIFVAIMLYCGANGIDEIPLDARFMSSVLVADERTIAKSFEELLFKKLLVEKKEREEKTDKKSTDRQEENASLDVPCVPMSDFGIRNADLEIQDSQVEGQSSNAENQKSIFSIDECLKYVEICQNKGDDIKNAKGLASHLFKTGEADSFILATLFPEKAKEKDIEIYGAPRQFSDEPCKVCYGAKMANPDGRGFRKCEHCRDEKGRATGLEPFGEIENEQTIYAADFA